MIGGRRWSHRRVVLFVALPVFCLLVTGAVLTSVPAMEDELERRATADLAAAGIDISTLRVSFSGRSATVTGTVDSQSARVTIDDIVKRDGVRSVTVDVRNTGVDGPADRVVSTIDGSVIEEMIAGEQALTLRFEEGTYVLRGRVRTVSNRDALIRHVASLVAPSPVRFELQVDSSVASTDDFSLLLEVLSVAAVDANRLALVVDAETLVVDLGTALDPTEIERQLQELADGADMQALLDVQGEAPLVTTQDRLAPITEQFVGEALFVAGGAELSPGAVGLLVEVAEVLRETDDQVEIRVHVDGQPGEESTALATAQAEVIVSQLGLRGVAPSRMNAVSFGADEPVAEVGDPANTRVEIEVVS